MELPQRPKGTTLLPPGAMTEIRRRLRLLAARNDLVSVIACAFDHRTRMLPFIYADLRRNFPVRAPDGGPAAHALPGTRRSPIEPAAKRSRLPIRIGKAA
jgi:hypothetical protein